MQNTTVTKNLNNILPITVEYMRKTEQFQSYKEGNHNDLALNQSLVPLCNGVIDK